MNYYEELGVRPDASAEEIRQAYRSLARLLHPDQQAAEPLRRLAEDRMKRLNSAYATLADSNRRHQYDTALVRLPAAHARPARLRARDGWAFAAGLVFAVLCWRLSVPREGIRTAPAGPEQRAPSRTVARPRTAANRARRPALMPALRQKEPEPAITFGDLTSGALPSPPALGPQPVITVPSSPAMLAPPPAVAPRSVPAAPVGGFAGTWVYVPPRTSTQEKSLYPAEYVEAVIVEDGDKLRGRYRARYQVPDRPISSEVVFRFEGSANSDTASLTWIGAAGAEGELKLKLVSNNTLQAEWIATALGAQLGLTSGISRLTRRLDP